MRELTGHDRVDHDLNCIKGGGGCHLREKVLAEAADTFVLVADYRKNSDVLGKNVSLRCICALYCNADGDRSSSRASR